MDAMSASKKNFAIVLCLIQFENILYICSVTYVTAYFLSTYPSAWLAYLYIAQGIVLALTGMFVTPIAAKIPKTFAIALSICGLIAVMAMHVLSLLPLPWIAFLICTIIYTVSMMYSINAWNYAALIMSVREFKRANRWLLVSSSIGGLVFGLLLPLLIQIWGLITALICMGIALTGSIPIYKITRPKMEPMSKIDKQPENAFKFPLFRNAFVTALIIGVLIILADFSFKTELAIGRTEDQIAQFTSIFMAVLNVFTFCVQVFILSRVQQRYGLLGVFLLFPLLIVVASLLYFLHHSLFTAIIMYGIALMLQDSTVMSSREQVLNILPSKIRTKGKFIDKTFGIPLSMVLAALVTFIVGNYFNVGIIGLIMFLSCLAIIPVIFNLSRSYQKTLKDALILRRFNSLQTDIDQFNEDQYKDFVKTALESDSEDLNLVGINLLNKRPLEKVPNELITLVDKPSTLLKTSAIKALRQFQDNSISDLFIKKFNSEQDLKVRCLLLNSLEKMDPKTAATIAADLLDDENPMLRATAISVILSAGDLTHALQAADNLKFMLQSDQAQDRANASRSLERFKIGDITDTLRVLINDEDIQTSQNAILSAMATKNTSLIKDIIEQMPRDHVRFTAITALIKFNDTAVNPIAEEYHQVDLIQQLTMIRILSRIKHSSAEQQLIACVDESSIEIMNTIAKYSAYRNSQINCSEQFIDFATKMVDKEVIYIKFLKNKLMELTNDFQKIEIQARIRESKIRFLYWLSVCSNPEILKTIPLIIANLKKTGSEIFETSLELIDTYLTNATLSNYLAEIFEESDDKVGQRILTANPPILDTWLDKVLATTSTPIIEKGVTMDTVQKMMVLRHSKLFQELGAEALLAIAEEAHSRETYKDERIYSTGEPADAIYIVASGQVRITKDDKEIVTLNEGGFFGIASVLDNSLLATDATALSDGVILYIDKVTFDKITDDLPEVLRAMTKLILTHLKQDLTKDSI